MSIEKINQGDQLTHSMDLVQENIQRLKELFPEIVAEGKIDFNVLQEVLGNELEDGEEYYRFTWAGKSQARREAHKPSTGTLRPCKEDSVDWDSTENIYIEGDNLEVLKLLQKSYASKIKIISIDPPYNTGKDFVYKDNYKDNLKNYQEITGQIDSEGNKLSSNSESDGRYHSNWLNMMYPRLILARNLLREDGVIFINIDDNEVHNLRKIGDEIFGEENFIIEIAWRKSDNQANIGSIARVKEYIICYAKKKSLMKLNKIPLTEKAKKEYSYKDTEGNFRRAILLDKTRGRHYYDVITKNGKTLNGPWMIKEEEFKEKDKNNEILWTNSGDEQPYGKIYLHKSTGQIANDFWDTSFGSNQEASLGLEKLFQNRVFDFSKSTKLLRNLFTIGSDKDSIILDFFAGSSSSAESVIQLNANDSGNRKFIQVQIPVLTDEKSDSYKAGYKTISDIGKERIRRAGKQIVYEKSEEIAKLKSRNSLLSEDKEDIDKLELIVKNIDIGFKVFKLDSSNIKGWDGNPDELEKSLFDSQDNIKTDRTEEDVLFEILLKYGLDLTLPIDEKLIEGKKVFNVGVGALFICLADGITSKVAEGVGAWKQELQPEACRVIFKDSGFTDVEKTNSVQILKRFGITEVKSI